MLNKKQLKKSLNSQKAISAMVHSRSPEKTIRKDANITQQLIKNEVLCVWLILRASTLLRETKYD